jgi:hypothetical protein
MEADDLGPVGFFFKMAEHGILDHRAQIIPIFALGEDTVAERARAQRPPSSASRTLKMISLMLQIWLTETILTRPLAKN